MRHGLLYRRALPPRAERRAGAQPAGQSPKTPSDPLRPRTASFVFATTRAFALESVDVNYEDFNYEAALHPFPGRLSTRFSGRVACLGTNALPGEHPVFL